MSKMQFEVVIGNPPYDGRGEPLHLQFLSKCIDLTKSKGHVAFLQPSTFLIDQKKENKHYQEIRNKIGYQLLKVQLFPKGIFSNAANNTSISATYLQKDINNINNIDVEYVTLQKTVKFKSIEEINQFANRDLFIDIKNKVLNWCNSYKNLHSDFVNKHADPSKFSISIPAFQRFKFFGDDTTVQTGIIEKCLQYDSEDLALAVLDYLNDDFSKFCLHIFKPNMHMHSGRPLRSVPSFNTPADFKNAKDLIGITDDEYAFIKEVANNNKDYFFFS